MTTHLKLLAAVAAIAFSAGMAHAADAASAPTGQQGKMKTCNMEAKGKKGAERKAFMKECLSGKHAMDAAPMASAPMASAPMGSASASGGGQQGKMKSCNAEAKTKALRGADRKAFMKECLSNK